MNIYSPARLSVTRTKQRRPRYYGTITAKAELAALVGEINGRHGEIDWMPIRYSNKGFSQLILAGFYRVASVGRFRTA